MMEHIWQHAKTLIEGMLNNEHSYTGHFVVDKKNNRALWRNPNDISNNYGSGLWINYGCDGQDVLIHSTQWECEPIHDSVEKIKSAVLQNMVAHLCNAKKRARTEMVVPSLPECKGHWAGSEGDKFLLYSWIEQWQKQGHAEALEELINSVNSNDFTRLIEAISFWSEVVDTRVSVEPTERDVVQNLMGWLAVVAWKHQDCPYTAFPGLVLENVENTGIRFGMRKFVFDDYIEHKVYVRVPKAGEPILFNNIVVCWRGDSVNACKNILRNIALGSANALSRQEIINRRCAQVLQCNEYYNGIIDSTTQEQLLEKMLVWFGPGSPARSWYNNRQDCMDALCIGNSLKERWPWWVEYARQEINAPLENIMLPDFTLT